MAADHHKHAKLLSIILLVLFLVILASLVSLYSPAAIVDRLGMRNAYLITFVVSLFGGFSAAGSVSFISLLAVLVVGGAYPLGLAVTAGTSLTIGDIFMFYLGGKGREALTGKWQVRVERLAGWFLPVSSSGSSLRQSWPIFTSALRRFRTIS